MRFILALLALCGSLAYAEEVKPIRVLVWDERQEKQKLGYGDEYLGNTIAAYLGKQPGLKVKSVGLPDKDQGLDAATLDDTDVIVWWGHIKQNDVTTEHTKAVVQRVLDGKIGFLALHSAHWCRPFVELMNERAKADALKEIPEAERSKLEIIPAVKKAPKVDDPLTPRLEKVGDIWKLHMPICVFPSWREDGKPSHVTTLLPDHPIAAGLPVEWTILKTEMYKAPFHVPKPDATVFEEKWDAGEHFYSGSVWTVGKGKVVYFRPGHESYPVYKAAEPLKVVENSVRWLGAELKK